MQLDKNDIHVWLAHLDISSEHEKKALAVLSHDECERANRFQFPIHRQYFVAARATLRYLLRTYLSVPAKDIIFSYTEHDKPYLKFPSEILSFNLSHSGAIAMYAFSLNGDLGIDIEKIYNDYPIGIVERFFSEEENKHFSALSDQEKIKGFYRIWSRKEAVIKAIGKGLAVPLSSFSVSVEDQVETIHIDHQAWSILPLLAPGAYQAAIAINQPLEFIKLKYNEFSLQAFL